MSLSPAESPNRLGTIAEADDPWSNYDPTIQPEPAASAPPATEARTEPQLNGNASQGASSSSVAPKQNGSARSKLTEELDNLDLTWSAPDTPEHVADNAAGAGAEPVDVQEEGHAQHTFDEEAGTDEAVGSAITLREVGVSVSPGTEGGAPGGRFAPHSDFGSERGAGADRRADDDGKTFQGDRANVAQDEEDDGEEAFVYPGADTADDDTAAEAAADARPARSSGEAPQVGLGATSSAVRTAQIDAALASTLADVAATSAHPSEPASAPAPAPAPAPSAPIDHARLSHLCSTGPLSALQAFFASTAAEAGTSSFALANEANPASGYSPLHYAAREGKLEIAKWLVEECGALVEMEDREGETALHKAALAGKLPLLSFLLGAGASAHATDADGWTALHNACARGYLDIARVLIENAGARVGVKGGRGGWTPLMNAASNGHLPIVRYLTAKHHADPFMRNMAGETAYDVAAATFEIYICEVLERYEADRWAALKFAGPPPAGAGAGTKRIVPGQGPYNPLALHTTVPVMVYENQRLDTRLKTLAVHGGKPRWSATSAARPHKPDRRPPFAMSPGPLGSRTRHLPLLREEVQLPTRQQPYKLPLPSRSSAATARKAAAARASADAGAEEFATTPTRASVLNERRASASSQPGDAGASPSTAPAEDERSHFWLSEWQPDLTHPLVDVEEGWQYARSFDDSEERWTGEVAPPLARLLDGRGLSSSVSRAVGAAGNANGTAGDQEATPTSWVRRRRWVRVMRRRLDIEFGDELEAAETLPGTALDIYEAEGNVDMSGLDPSADYVARAEYIAGKSAVDGSTPADALGEDAPELWRRIARLEMAVSELRNGAFGDENSSRRGRAEDLLKEYTVQLGQLRQAAGFDEGDEDPSDEDEDEEEFIYPGSFRDDGTSVITRLTRAPVPPRPAIPQRHSSTASVAASIFGATAAPSEYGGYAPSVVSGPSRSADLAASTEFRVPMNEAPNKAPLAGRGPVLRPHHLQPQWERDEDVQECRGCSRRFTFFLRKHHCRRCGRIYCDSCSSRRAQLGEDELIVDPSMPEMFAMEALGHSRICNACDAERQLPPVLRNPRGAEALLRRSPSRNGSIREDELGDDVAPGDVSSRASELNECPVCSTTLAKLGSSEEQEAHVRACLENGGGGSIQGGRYLVYKLPDNSPIIGKECIICMEDFVPASTVARLPCLCFFHRACIDSWFKRGRACPVHARDFT